MFEIENDTTVTITPKNPESKWVALDENNNIIAEGENPNDVIEAAKKAGKEFTIMFVPLKGNTYIF